ncbi:Uncharacterized protein dnm_097320 [Desulfonema magnum]|uniref:Uncharacterized protein n=1 Tax=Desulfonema magnum TaxID=45655 RepID=A0A975GVT6_9BACT|nr:Uncharacterized protein dnm_097320 [Desulfonema magnum]
MYVLNKCFFFSNGFIIVFLKIKKTTGKGDKKGNFPFLSFPYPTSL